MIDQTTPQARVAQQFMEHKGLGYVRPYDVDKLDGQPCWYFYYDLPEGDLELEVFWDGEIWQTKVTSFPVAS